jgi:hypothetical protein
VLRIRDPVLFYLPDPGSGMELCSDPDPGSRKFVNSLYTKIGRIRDPVLFTPRIRDGAMVGSGSGIWDKQTKFVNSLYTKIGRIRDPVLFLPPDPGSGSGMEQWSDPDPG